MLQTKQYAWTLDEHAEGYSCVFVYITGDKVETRLHLDNPNAALAFQKLLIAAGYKYKQIKIVTTPAWAVQ